MSLAGWLRKRWFQFKARFMEIFPYISHWNTFNWSACTDAPQVRLLA